MGLDDSWRVDAVAPRLDERQVEIRLVHGGAGLVCPECGQSFGLDDHAEERRWRHLDTMQFTTELVAQLPRSRCPEHGVKTSVLPWAGKHSFALDRLADLIPPPREHRRRYHGVFAPNHPLRPAVTALAGGNVGKQHDVVTGGHGGDGHGPEGCCDAKQKPRSRGEVRAASSASTVSTTTFDPRATRSAKRRSTTSSAISSMHSCWPLRP